MLGDVLKGHHGRAGVFGGLRRFGIDRLGRLQGGAERIGDGVAQRFCGGFGGGLREFAGLRGGFDHAGRLHQLFV